ncbi:transporter [Hymenobacter defluvii]
MRLLSTDRPDVTESAYSVDAGHFQVETDVLRLGRSRLKRQPVAQQELRFNHANLKLGLTHNVDLQVVVESYTVQTEGEGDTGTRRAGFGDVTLRLKRNLWGNDGGPTAFALMPFVKLPRAATAATVPGRAASSRRFRCSCPTILPWARSFRPPSTAIARLGNTFWNWLPR